MPREKKFRFGAVTNGKAAQPQPEIRLVWVQCAGYRCLAYATKGKWINFYTGKPLADFVEIIE